MATYTFDKIEYSGNTYVVSDSGALQLTGGQVTGPVTFGNTITVDEATLGDLVVTGNASVTNNLQVNTINGVAVGSSPKFTDNNTTYSAGTGLSLSSTTFNHSNSVTAQTTQAVYPIKIDAQGHISAYGSAQTILSIGTGSSNAAAGNHTHSYLPLSGGTLTGRLTTADPVNQIITGSGTAASDKGSGVSPRYFPAKWTFNTGQTATNGDIITIKIPVAGHTYGVFLSINNGTNYHPVVVGNGTSRLTTHYGNGTPIQLIFDSNGSAADMYALNGADARATVTGGVWRVLNYYADGNTIPQAYCSTAAATAAKVASMSSYVATAKRHVMITIVYANTAASAITMNINSTGAKPIYINGSASSTSNYTLPAGSYLVYYDGTNYYFRTDGHLQSVNGILTANAGTITSVKTTAGAHTTINVTSGAANFNVPTTAAHVGIKFGYTTSGNNRAVLQDSSGNLYVTQKDDNTTYSSKAAASGGTDVSLCTTGEKYTWNSKTSNTGTVTSITLTQGDGISIGSSGTAITTSGSRTIALSTSGATAGSYGPSANASPSAGGTFSVPYITIDKYGRVTASSTKTITLPANHYYTAPSQFTAVWPSTATGSMIFRKWGAVACCQLTQLSKLPVGSTQIYTDDNPIPEKYRPGGAAARVFLDVGGMALPIQLIIYTSGRVEIYNYGSTAVSTETSYRCCMTYITTTIE